MKTRLIITLFFLLSVSIYLFIGSSPEKTDSPVNVPINTGGDNFIIGAYNTAWDINFKYLRDTLGFNLWHTYTGNNEWGGRHYPTGWLYWAHGDTLFAPHDNYVGDVQNTIGSISSHNMKVLMMRPKIEWLCFGQRSDYQCEDVSSGDDLWFYSFQSPNHAGADIWDTHDSPNGTHVRYCRPGNSTNEGNWIDYAGMVVSRLRANSEQCNSGNSFFGDNECDWLIKPRIRIDSSVAHNSGNTNVCRIIVLKENRDTIKNTVIKASNFINPITGNYAGQYLEEFYNLPPTDSLKYHGAWGTNPIYSARGDNANDIGADIQVYWYGNCDMWIDYVRVDNDVADGLLNPNSSNNGATFNQWLQWEAHDILSNNSEAVYRFYIELFEFNNIPCMAYVSHKLDSIAYASYGKHITLMSIPVPTFYTYHVPWADRLRVMNVQNFEHNYIEKVGVSEVYLGYYPFNSSYHHLRGGGEPDPYPTWARIPNTLPRHSGDGTLALAVDPDVYDTWLQNYLDSIPYSFENGYTGGMRLPVENDMGGFRYTMQLGDKVSKDENIPFIYNAQAHMWFCKCGAGGSQHTGASPNEITGEVQREPTNEELDLTANLPVSYGARGLIYFQFISYDYDIGDTLYDRGMMDPKYNSKPRYINIYGQEKWKKIISVVQRMKTWEPYIMSFDNANRHSYIYRLAAERNDLLNPANSYFADVVTYKPGTVQPQCPVEIPPGGTSPTNMIYECNDDRYLQVATFNKPSDISGYFMIINRRCSPYKTGYVDGSRQIKVRFNANSDFFPHYSNWKLVDLGTKTKILEFDKHQSTLIDLGTFDPGEGRLYGVFPVLPNGGMLVADENISGETFTCLDTVWNNGHNITITGNSTLSFTDSATIIMNGGTFQTGSSSNGPGTQYNTFQGTSGHKWNGLQFTGTIVKLYNAKFQDINGTVAGGNYAVTCIDCPLNDIRYSNFVMGNDTAGAVNIAYTSSNDNGVYSYIKYNTFTMNSSYGRAIQIQGFAGSSAGTYIENNTLSSDGNAIGMFLSTVSSGSVRNNTLSNCVIGINSSLSTMDLYGNTISNSTSVSDGIKAVSSSTINLGPNSGQYTGGFNSITSSSGASNDIEVNNSNFNIEKGANTFDVPSSGYHLYGSNYSASYSAQATKNCFKIGGTAIADTSSPINHVLNSKSSLTTYTFPTYNCSPTLPTGQTIVDIGNGMYDTIPALIGLGGSYSSVPAPKLLYDSLHVLMMFRNYGAVKNLCYALINTFPDSTESSEALQTLYMASVASDTSQASLNTLKSYYEGLILSHPDNTAMVTISNYLALKCRVLLKQYSQALSGFQQIINNNPYSYDGLMARWDYMATSLLMSGSGGGENDDRPLLDKEGKGTPEEFLGWSDGDDKSPFSKEQRTNIRKSIITTLDDNRKTDEQKIDILTLKAKNGDISAQKELKQKINLKSVIKTERPKNIIEHMKIVNADIQKVFGSKENYSSKNQNNVPTAFNLYQNYPNPFNPVSTIKFAIPNDIKVVIKVYDILGREVRTLVNEIRKAGYYEEKFDGTNLASGVYFYRIEAGTYVNSKKMVLVK